MSCMLANALKKKCHNLSDTDIIIDVTPSKQGKEYYDLKRLQVWNLRKRHYEDLPPGMIQLDAFLQENQRVHILPPKFSLQLAELSAADWNGIFSEIVTSS